MSTRAYMFDRVIYTDRDGNGHDAIITHFYHATADFLGDRSYNLTTVDLVVLPDKIGQRENTVEADQRWVPYNSVVTHHTWRAKDLPT